MISLLQATWIESFKLLTSADSKLYLLLIANTFVKSLRLLFTYFFWLIPLALYGHVAVLQELMSLKLLPTGKLFSPIFVTNTFLEMLWYFALLLIVRASLEVKGYTYFIYYSPRVFYTALFWLIPLSGAFPLAWIAGFFFLDSSFSYKNILSALKNGVRMILYFFPLFIVASITSFLLIQSVKFPCMVLFKAFIHPSVMPLFIMDYFFTALHSLFIASMLSVLYIVIKHRHYSLFYPE